MCYFALKRYAEAVEALTAYLDHEPDLESEAQQKV